MTGARLAVLAAAALVACAATLCTVTAAQASAAHCTGLFTTPPAWNNQVTYDWNWQAGTTGCTNPPQHYALVVGLQDNSTGAWNYSQSASFNPQTYPSNLTFYAGSNHPTVDPKTIGPGCDPTILYRSRLVIVNTSGRAIAGPVWNPLNGESAC